MIFAHHSPTSTPLAFDDLRERVSRGIRFWGRLLCCLGLAIGLSGCMDYGVGIQFNTQNSGAIVQHIHLDRMTTLGSVTLEQWFQSLEQRTQQLQGYSRHSSPQDLELTLPFANGADLVKKFNQLFAASEPSVAETALFPMSAHLELKQQNALLAIRNQLDLTVDLRELGGITPQGEQLFDTDPLLHLKVYLQTPWGAQWAGSLPSQADQGGYALQSGQLNHLKATFWVPSPIGLGAAIIVTIVALGTYLHRRLKLSAINAIN
ncbi:MAG: DUF3153 domain-containing protein [Prochlorotrichaceae cyanobacterium]|jgi:hypothetical protein